MKHSGYYFLLVAFFIFSFLCYQGVLSYIPYYHEQHSLFLFSEAYFLQQMNSEGLLSYLTSFLVQFFYIPALGSALLASLLCIISLLIRFNIRKITGQTDKFLLSLLPSVYLFIHMMSAGNSLTPVVACFLGISVLSAINAFLPGPWKYVGQLSWLSIRGKKTNLLLSLFVILVYAGGTFYVFAHSYNRSERFMLLTEKYVKSRNWDEVLKQTNKYFSYGRSNQLMSYFHNLALYHTGGLPYHLFDYPQGLGVKSLYFPWNSDSRESEYGHFLYEDLGHTNEAQRWEFEAMVVWGETAPHLLNLAKYNIINHRPLVAQRFINLLKQSLFYKEEAEILEKQLSTGQVPGLRSSLTDVYEVPARFSNVMNIGPELLYLCEKDSTNRMAFEYLMSDLLLGNNVVRFAENLKYMKYFSYPQMPPNYEEALYIYKLGVDEETFAKLNLTISEETEQRFQRYYALYKNKNMQALKAEFGNTYWYYLNFYSPYGDKIIKN